MSFLMQTKKAKVCVLLATYNGEEYLEELLNSVFNQEGVFVSVFARDDGSTDKTQKILEQFAKSFHLTWYTGNRLGPEMSFLDLIGKAEDFDYYAFCDQDDVWEKNKLLSACSHNKSISMDIPFLYCSGLKVVDRNLSHLFTKSINKKRSNYGRFIYPGIAGCTMVFNYALKKIVKAGNPAYIRMHDTWVYDICTCVGGFVYLDDNSFIRYRQHGNNAVGLKKNSLAMSYRNFVLGVNISRHVQSLLDCYKSLMTPEYMALSILLSSSNKSFRCRWKLFFNRHIRFGRFGLDCLFRIKILLRKM